MVYGSQHHSLTARFLVGLYLGFDKRRTNENDVGGGEGLFCSSFRLLSTEWYVREIIYRRMDILLLYKYHALSEIYYNFLHTFSTVSV